jgi:alkaline phosphatase D
MNSTFLMGELFRVSSVLSCWRLVLVIVFFWSANGSSQDTTWPDPVANHVVPYTTGGISHGPLIGGVTSESIKVWVRTRKPPEFVVAYSKSLPITNDSPTLKGTAAEASDLTGVVEITGLKPNTRYYYAIRIDGVISDLRSEVSAPWPSFKTLPDKTSFVDSANNPNGLFNVTFAVGHCASQNPDLSGGQYTSTPAYDMIRKHHADEAMFGIVNGDVIYEELRDGTIGGVRDNYKLYFTRGRSFNSLFRTVPAFFTFDDHDVGWDIHGCGQIGLKEGRHLIRDVGLHAYAEYLSWANFRGPQSGSIRFGNAEVQSNSNILFDPAADFSALDPSTVSTIHLGNYTRAEKLIGKRKDAPKNAGVYGLVKVIDRTHLEITPTTRFEEKLPYSIGTHHYYDWKVSNCHFFALDTRGERSDRNPDDRADESLFILGPQQEKWLIDGIQNSDADFIFLISPDPWTIYHTAAHVGGDDKDDKGDGFPSFLDQRERLIGIFDGIKKPILIFTGDVHASASVKITDNVWEMMCGPLGSTGHPLATLGNPPKGGKWNSMGREVGIRWVSGFPNNLPYQKIRNTYYGMVQVNNVLKVASPNGGYQFTAYDEPQVVVRWHDGYTGRLVYAESITVGDAKNRK